MSFSVPINSFFKPRYLSMFLGLFTIILHGIITSFYLSHFFQARYGVELIKISQNDMNMWNDCDRITSLSLLFYPIISLSIIITCFLINKQKKELKSALLLYLLTLILVFGYLFYFNQSVVIYILPALMLIGAFSSYRGEYYEATRIFVLLFIILLLSYGADKLSMKYFSFEPL